MLKSQSLFFDPGTIALPRTYVRAPVVTLLCGACLASGYLSVMMARQMKMQQSIVEAEQRIPLGRWLAKNVPPNERVYVECLGYLGYFSGRRMLDWPGLVSPEVVRLRREGHDIHTVIPVLEPEWLVLRPADADRLRELKGMRQEYEHVARPLYSPFCPSRSRMYWHGPTPSVLRMTSTTV